MCPPAPKYVLSVHQTTPLCASPEEHRVPWGKTHTPVENISIPATILLAKGSGSSPPLPPGQVTLDLTVVHLTPYPKDEPQGQTEGKGSQVPSQGSPYPERKGHVWGPWGKATSSARGLRSVRTPSTLCFSLAHVPGWYTTLSKLWGQWLDQNVAPVIQGLPQRKKVYPYSLPWAEHGRTFQKCLD